MEDKQMRNDSMRKELAKALYKFSYGGFSVEQAEKKAKEVMANLNLDDEALQHKGVNWIAKQVIKKEIEKAL